MDHRKSWKVLERFLWASQRAHDYAMAAYKLFSEILLLQRCRDGDAGLGRDIFEILTICVIHSA